MGNKDGPVEMEKGKTYCFWERLVMTGEVYSYKSQYFVIDDLIDWDVWGEK